jgi:purine nucleosidase
MAVPLVLDTDIGSDVDDALALAFALRHPDIDLLAVTTVADDTVRRGHIARKLLQLAGRDDVEVAAGVGWETSPSGRKSWFGHEGEGLLELDETLDLSPRDGVTLLLETPDVHIATVGMQSNIAAALERDASFARRVPLLAVMGGVFARIRVGDGELPPSVDHNLCVDAEASVKALNAGIPTLYVPLDVTIRTRITPVHVEALRKGDDLCRALARLVDVWSRTAPMPPGTSAIMHDPLTVACLVERRFVETKREPVTVALRDGTARTFIDPLDGRQAQIVTSVDADDFAAFWLQTVLG